MTNLRTCGTPVSILPLTLYRFSAVGDEDVTYIIILGEAKELADLGGTLWTKTLWVDSVGDTWDVLLALLDDGESEDGEVHGNDASANGLTLALAGAAWAVAGVSVREEKADTGWVHNSLLHWETLLVVASSDLEDVALELITNGVTWDLSAHALLHEDTELALVLNLDQLLGAIGWLIKPSVFRSGATFLVRLNRENRRRVRRRC